MRQEILKFISSSITGNTIGFVSLLIGIVGLIITIKTLMSAKQIEDEMRREKINAIDKSKFHRNKEDIVKKLNQKRSAASKQHRISLNLCMDIISITNDLITHDTVFTDRDYKKINQSKSELNQLIEMQKNNRDDESLFCKFDEIVARLINILEKGEYDL